MRNTNVLAALLLLGACNTAGPASLTLVSPQDPAQPMSVLTVFEIHASPVGAPDTVPADLDPLTVNAQTVVLTDEFDEVVPGTVGYDPDTGTITLAPQRALFWARHYTLNVQNVGDRGGRMAEPLSVPLRTYVNPVAEITSYNTDQSVRYFFRYERDELGNELALHSYDAPGPDHMFGTDDDVQTNLVLDDRRAGLVIASTYNSAGPDGLWGTPDDVLVSPITASDLDARGRAERLRYVDPGPDLLYGTDDDLMVGWVGSTWDGGDRHSTLSYDGAGADGQWSAHLTRTESGQDGIAGTADDTVTGRQLFTFDEHGRLTAQQEIAGPGPDRVWETDDDTARSITLYEYGEHDNLARSVEYTGPGGDGAFRTPDDQLGGIRDYDTQH